jgi:hypothetical protein
MDECGPMPPSKAIPAEKGLPLNRLAEPEEVAGMICSPVASRVLGADCLVDDGLVKSV